MLFRTTEAGHFTLPGNYPELNSVSRGAVQAASKLSRKKEEVLGSAGLPEYQGMRLPKEGASRLRLQ